MIKCIDFKPNGSNAFLPVLSNVGLIPMHLMPMSMKGVLMIKKKRMFHNIVEFSNSSLSALFTVYECIKRPVKYIAFVRTNTALNKFWKCIGPMIFFP